MDVADVDSRVVRVVDVKTPASGEVERNRLDNLQLLRADEQIKFVVCDRADFEWARDMVLTRRLSERCTVLFSPSYGQLEARELAQWILDERLPVRLQVQLHKYLWGDTPGR
jgi:7-carboxy-7-deazaguanine synthase